MNVDNNFMLVIDNELLQLKHLLAQSIWLGDAAYLK